MLLFRLCIIRDIPFVVGLVNHVDNGVIRIDTYENDIGKILSSSPS